MPGEGFIVDYTKMIKADDIESIIRWLSIEGVSEKNENTNRFLRRLNKMRYK